MIDKNFIFSRLPEEAAFVSMDESGEWFWHIFKPFPMSMGWIARKGHSTQISRDTVLVDYLNSVFTGKWDSFLISKCDVIGNAQLVAELIAAHENMSNVIARIKKLA